MILEGKRRMAVFKGEVRLGCVGCAPIRLPASRPRERRYRRFICARAPPGFVLGIVSIRGGRGHWWSARRLEPAKTIVE